MDALTAFFIYLLIWWVTLFAVLPLGVERHTDEGKGHDAGAPKTPDLKKKIIINTIVSAIILALIYILVELKVITWGDWFRGAIK